jgi:UDP-N-acetylglucosamine 2-epimerase (non-hydrolysing)
MMPPRDIILVGGARPNFMKIAPLYRALAAGIDGEGGGRYVLRIAHTGQHYDPQMSEIFFRELGLPDPDFNLSVGSASHAVQTARIMTGFEEILARGNVALVVVVGDVNSTIACALTAKKMFVPVAHVEAGLRSFDRTMPEEINRILTDAISDLLFVTEKSGMENLDREGVPPERRFLVGNVMVDTLLAFKAKMERGETRPTGGFQALCEELGNFALLTLHRPSTVDDRATFSIIWNALLEISRRTPLIFPVHPRTRAKMAEFGLSNGSIIILDPIGYVDMLYAMGRARLVLTDSGGVQEETTVLGTPCMTLRENTERPSTVETGTNYLVGHDPLLIENTALAILNGSCKKGGLPPFWDGHAAERIAMILLARLDSKSM